MDRDEWATTHQHFEEGWWGDCANTYGEETKQLRAYAPLMMLRTDDWHGGDKWPKYPVRGRVLDVGGGPVSMLLKCERLTSGSAVVDPCDYPAWTAARYAEHGIDVLVEPAEEYLPTVAENGVEEAWCYNVLQHVIDPEKIVAEMCRAAKRVRFFEWIETAPYLGHPHTLHAADLERWIGQDGRVRWFDEQYAQIGPESESTVRQQAWGGSFYVG